MAKKAQPSTLEETPLPTEEATPSETPAVAEEQETKPPEEGEVEPEPKEEKPDFAALLAGLSKDERKAILKENLGEELTSLEQAANDRALQKLQGEQQRRVQANQEIRDTLKNLGVPEDDNEGAGHIQAYAARHAQSELERSRMETMDNIRDSLGVSREEHDEIAIRLHQAASRENRVATFGDYIKHVTGERFMPKGDYTKQIRAEIKAELAEQQGRAIENQPAPVSTGPGEPASTKNPEQKWLDKGCPESGPIYDEYMQWRKSSLVF